MLLGESLHRSIPAVQVPLWDPLEDPTSPLAHSPFTNVVSAFHRCLSSNEPDSLSDDDLDSSIEAFSCDHFRMYKFKVRRCARARAHDWTECPFAHPGEKARRRDPLRYNYSGTPCPEYRQGGCKKRDTCEFAHGVFECWLHPNRYRTQPCKDGAACRRRVCFFAHTPEQLRVLHVNHSPKNSRRYDFHFESPRKIQVGSFSSSPLMSPSSEISSCSHSFEDALRGLHVGEVSWSFESGSSTRGLGSVFRFEEEPEMERVESGKELREKMYQKLSQEFSLNRGNSMTSLTDVDCVTGLVN